MKVSSKNQNSFEETTRPDMRKQKKTKKRPLSDPILGTRMSFPLSLPPSHHCWMKFSCLINEKVILLEVFKIRFFKPSSVYLSIIIFMLAKYLTDFESIKQNQKSIAKAGNIKFSLQHWTLKQINLLNFELQLTFQISNNIG